MIEEKEKKETNQDEDSALIQDLDNACNAGLEGWKNYVTQSLSGRARTDQIMEENVDNFLNNTVPLLSFEIKEIIDGLIRVDDYPKGMFCAYEKIFDAIQNTDNIHERAKQFRKLIICAKTVIPLSIQFVKPKIITPTIAKVTGSNEQ